MKKTKKWLLGVLLMMNLMLMSMNVFAASTVAKIGSKNYTSLEKAIAAVKNGDTIKIVKSISTRNAVKINKNVSFTIDFNKKAYKFSSHDNAQIAFIVNKGTVTFKNAKISSDSDILQVKKSGKAVISSGTYSGDYISVLGMLTINGGTFKARGVSPLLDVGKSGQVTIKKATFQGKSHKWDSGYALPENPGYEEFTMIENSGSLTIKGGTYNSARNMAVLNRGTLNITGGSFTTARKSGEDCCIRNDASGKVTITGGTFRARGQVLKNLGSKATMTLKGGKFLCDEGDSIWNEGKAVISGGTYIYVDNCGTMTINGGTITRLIYCCGNGKVTINNVTINQDKGGGPDQAMLLVDGQNGAKATINVRKGSFTSKKGYLYSYYGKGKITINEKNCKIKVKDKELKVNVEVSAE